MNFVDLPSEILRNIGQFLDYKSKFNAYLSCKRLNDLWVADVWDTVRLVNFPILSSTTTYSSEDSLKLPINALSNNSPVMQLKFTRVVLLDVSLTQSQCKLTDSSKPDHKNLPPSEVIGLAANKAGKMAAGLVAQLSDRVFEEIHIDSVSTSSFLSSFHATSLASILHSHFPWAQLSLHYKLHEWEKASDMGLSVLPKVNSLELDVSATRMPTESLFPICLPRKLNWLKINGRKKLPLHPSNLEELSAQLKGINCSTLNLSNFAVIRPLSICLECPLNRCVLTGCEILCKIKICSKTVELRKCKFKDLQLPFVEMLTTDVDTSFENLDIPVIRYVEIQGKINESMKLKLLHAAEIYVESAIEDEERKEGVLERLGQGFELYADKIQSVTFGENVLGAIKEITHIIKFVQILKNLSMLKLRFNSADDAIIAQVCTGLFGIKDDICLLDNGKYELTMDLELARQRIALGQ